MDWFAFLGWFALVASVLLVVHRGGVGPAGGVLSAALLLVIGMLAGFSPGDLGLVPNPSTGGVGAGWAGAGIGSVAAAYGLAALIPAVRRRAFAGREAPPRPLHTALVAIPLATVLVEEIAFRGVLWALIARDHGLGWAAAGTSVLFGLWHIRPRRDRPLVVAGTVLFTTVAGAVFAVLRIEGGTLLAPVAVHWAANGLGVLAIAWAARHRHDKA